MVSTLRAALLNYLKISYWNFNKNRSTEQVLTLMSQFNDDAWTWRAKIFNLLKGCLITLIFELYSSTTDPLYVLSIVETRINKEWTGGNNNIGIIKINAWIR